MKISRTVEYALISAAFLANKPKEGYVMIKEIAQAYNIPRIYLQQVLQQLVRAGIMKSKKGPYGGFNLAKPATKITLLDIVEAIDGPVQASTGLTGEATKKAEKAFIDVSKTAKASFAKVTIADVAGKK